MSDLIERIDAAICRIANGEGTMRVPVDETDPDMVLADCQKEIERLSFQRNNALSRCDMLANLLTRIYELLYPPPMPLPDGRTMVFKPSGSDPHAHLQALSDLIRALPEELAKEPKS